MKFYNMKNIFNNHPNSVGETYLQHLFKAFNFGYKLTVMSIQAFIHGIFPWCFEHTVSDKIKKLNDVLQKRKESLK